MASPDEASSMEKLRRIEALHAGATTPGERDDAQTARQRMLARLAALAAAPAVAVLAWLLHVCQSPRAKASVSANAPTR